MKYLALKCTIIEIKNSQDKLKNWMEIIEKTLNLKIDLGKSSDMYKRSTDIF